MVTMTEIKPIEQEVESIPYPELPHLPEKTIGFCPLIGVHSRRFPPDMPKRVQNKIAEAIPIFGMGIRVFYPKPERSWFDPLWGPKGDPLVIGEKEGKFYLIAAWE